MPQSILPFDDPGASRGGDFLLAGQPGRSAGEATLAPFSGFSTTAPFEANAPGTVASGNHAAPQNGPGDAAALGPFLLSPRSEPPPVPELSARPATMPPPLPARLDDRHGLLAIAGAFWVVAGFALSVPLPMAIARDGFDVLARGATGMPLALNHFLAPVILIALGLGSIFAKRWARHVLLAMATVAFGAVLAFWAAQFFAGLREGTLPNDTAGWARWSGLCLAVLAIPWCVIAFYSHRETRATCERRHPRAVWSDRLPEGILLLAVFCAAAAWACALQIFAAPFPAFGALVEGPSGQMAWGSAAAVFLIAALLNAGRQLAGWWLALAGITAVTGSLVWTLLLGSRTGIDRWWSPPELTATDAACLAGGLFLLALAWMGSLFPRYRGAAEA